MEDPQIKRNIASFFPSKFEPIFDNEANREFLPSFYYRFEKSYRYVNARTSLLDRH